MTLFIPVFGFKDPADTVYNGAAQEQKPVVRDSEGRILVENRDYVLSWENNTNAGEATVKITGIGNYGGEVTKAFTIAQRPVVITVNPASKMFGTADSDFSGSSSLQLLTGWAL